MKLGSLSITALIFAASAHAEVFRFESTDPKSPMQMVVIDIQGTQGKGSLVYSRPDFSTVEQNHQVSFSNDFDISWTAFTLYDVSLAQLKQVPAGEELEILGEMQPNDGKHGIFYSVITTGNLNLIKYRVLLKPENSILAEGTLQLVAPATPSSAMSQRIQQRLSPYVVIKPENEKDCLQILGESCAAIVKTIQSREKTELRKADPFSILDPQWRLPVFGTIPPQSGQPGQGAVVFEPPPYVQLNDDADFPELVRLAQITSLESKFPSFTGLLMGLGRDKRAYQCTTNYWHEGGWFSTSAHCIPEDLRNASNARSCAGRIFVKMPQSDAAQAVTLECDQIEFVSSYHGESGGEDLGPDLAYFRVKNPEMLSAPKPVVMDFNVKDIAIGSPVVLYVVNPVPDHPGLNGKIQKKLCQVIDPYQIKKMFPERAKLGYRF